MLYNTFIFYADENICVNFTPIYKRDQSSSLS